LKADEQMNVKLTKNTTVWIHEGAHGVRVQDCIFRHTGGYGVLVGPERETAARYRLDDVDDVLTWLEAVAGA
jgi:hypothetical protein